MEVIGSKMVKELALSKMIVMDQTKKKEEDNDVEEGD